ncbi:MULTISPECIES: response regulator [Bradyrhizobium]|uniref:response regulator n=1 Tax=Bradyrhizobium elkanii TaxID=29448 RepID=UPI0009B7DBCE
MVSRLAVRSPSAEDSRKHPRKAEASTLSNRRSVLVVDDDRSMLRSLKRLLGQYGFDTTLFDSASALLGHGDFGGAFCIILDINLNGQSGIDLRRRLLDKGITLPVIYITGNDSHANRTAATESGCVAYLTKPFSAKSLIEPIEKMAAAIA